MLKGAEFVLKGVTLSKRLEVEFVLKEDVHLVSIESLGSGYFNFPSQHV